MNNELSVDKIENVEKTTLNGMEAHVITVKDAKKFKPGNSVFLFNPEQGYVIQIWGYYTLPAEELKKVADKLEITKLEGETAAYQSSEEKVKEFEADQQYESEIFFVSE